MPLGFSGSRMYHPGNKQAEDFSRILICTWDAWLLNRPGLPGASGRSYQLNDTRPGRDSLT
jgi:hypothetical protein